MRYFPPTQEDKRETPLARMPRSGTPLLAVPPGAPESPVPSPLLHEHQAVLTLHTLLRQTGLGINIVFVAILFFVTPAFAPSKQQLSFVVFLVTINGASVIWNIAMIGLFLCGILLCGRYRQQLQGKWVVPEAVLYLAAALGILSSSVAISSTFFAGSPVQQALSNSDWDYYVLLVVVGSLAVGAVYSFLVPEVEDIMALMKKALASAPLQPGSAHEPRDPREERYAPAPPSPLVPSSPLPAAGVPGSLSGNRNQFVPGEQFARSPQPSRPDGGQDVSR